MVSVTDLITFLQAAHVAQDTACSLEARGGILLVAYPEQLKTTMVNAAYRVYPEVHRTSDMNVQDFSAFRRDLLTQRYDSVAFLDYQKIWERDDRTSKGVEGVIRALADEGWYGVLAGQQLKGTPARCFFVLCLTPTLYDSSLQRWTESGFLRRFLTIRYVFKGRRLLEEAIKEGRHYQFQTAMPIMRPMVPLPYEVTKEESDAIAPLLVQQRSLLALEMLLRIYNTLRWHFECKLAQPAGTAMEFLQGMASLFTTEGGEVVVNEKEDWKKPEFVSVRTGQPIKPTEEVIEQFRTRQRAGNFVPPELVSVKNGEPLKRKRKAAR